MREAIYQSLATKDDVADLGDVVTDSVAAVSACEHGDLLLPESAATQVPVILTIGN